MIPVKFISYRDKLKTRSWPLKVCFRPMEGDLVQANCGTYGKVTTICHTVEDGWPMLIVTLVEV